MKKQRVGSLCMALTLCMGLLPTAQAQAAMVGTTEVIYQCQDYYITKTPILDNGDTILNTGVRVFNGVALSGGMVRISRYQTDGYDPSSGIPKRYWTYLDENGVVLFTIDEAQYGEVSDFSEGLARVNKDGVWGYIDQTGTLVVPHAYEAATDFSEGRAAVQKDGNWGYIDQSGTLVIPCIYQEAQAFSEGRGEVRLDGMEGYIDTMGNVVIPIENSWVTSFSEGLAEVRRMDGGIEVINSSGEVIISNEEVLEKFTVPKREASFSGAGPFAPYLGPITGLAPYSEGLMTSVYFDEATNTWCRGYADKTGEIVLKFPGYQIASYKNGLWWAEFGGSISPFSEGLAVISDSLYGYIDKTGKEVIAPQFANALSFSDGMAAVCETAGGLWAFINRQGDIVTPYQYTKEGNHFSEGLAAVQHQKIENGTWVNAYRDWSYIDKSGNTVLDGFLRASDFQGGLAVVSELTNDREHWSVLRKVTTAPTAYAATQSVLVDGTPVELQAYALKDEAGNATNYVKLRDVAQLLDSTAARFEVGYDGTITITTGRTYTPNGSEMSTPFSGNRPYRDSSSAVNVDGTAAALAAIVLTDDAGGGYTYFKLRDLGAALGFNVGWSAEQGIFIETDKPYSE